MLRFRHIIIAFLSIAVTVHAGELSLDNPTVPDQRAPYEFWETTFESGALWRVSGETHHDYLVLPQILSIRGPYQFKFARAFGGDFLVRPHVSLLAEAFVKGPENRYLGISGSPSIEWWSANRKLSTFFSIGGGVGWVDSQGVEGGQGQDFTFNWFVKQGVRMRISERASVSVAGFFQHISNRGATDPNPGLDAAGFLVGMSVTF